MMWREVCKVNACEPGHQPVCIFHFRRKKSISAESSSGCFDQFDGKFMISSIECLINKYRQIKVMSTFMN